MMSTALVPMTVTTFPANAIDSSCLCLQRLDAAFPNDAVVWLVSHMGRFGEIAGDS